MSWGFAFLTEDLDRESYERAVRRPRQSWSAEDILHCGVESPGRRGVPIGGDAPQSVVARHLDVPALELERARFQRCASRGVVAVGMGAFSEIDIEPSFVHVPGTLLATGNEASSGRGKQQAAEGLCW